MTFEEALARLEEIVACLEAGETSLEEALQLFEEGVGLARFCRSQLSRAEERLRILAEGPDGQAEERPVSGAEPGALGDLAAREKSVNE
ncbi:MAG: exodeoxyribonuclease VII small subunit [Firmicutes bacterium]|nr:exodeoxyribonuclease VII small subunit [Bacillota bacterium]